VNALIPTVDATLPAPAFRPKPKQLAYLLELVDRLADGKPTSDRQMAIAIGVDRLSLRKWQRNDAFNAWLHAELEKVRTQGKSRVLARAQALAERGSVEHMDFLAKVLGWYQTSALPGNAGPVQINILVPRP
jgi:hypothetical protein